MASSTEQPDNSSQPTATKSSGKGMTHLGKYRLIKKLGQGGMGEVYLAEDTKLGRHAAVKVLSKQLAGKSDFVQRFQREARAMAKMNHDNAVSVYDVDEHQGFHFVAMVAHNQSLIHRDIKPDNIMLTSKGKVKVADFGLAKATDEDMSMTQSGTGLGTPYYMAPEQARNAKHVDSRTDVYAIGITLYYFVTGKLPFAGDSVIQIITSKEKGHFTPARKLNPEVPERLDLIIDKLIAKDLNARCKDCAEVIKLLTSLGLESPSLSFITAPDRVVQTSAVTGRATTTQVAVARTIQMPAPGRTSAEDAARSKPAPAVTDQSWIVQYKTSQGKDTIGKFTTLQIQQAFKNKTLDQKAKAKKNVAEQFMPIGYFPEFEKYAEGRVIKDQADKKAGDMKSAYKEIERQYDRRGWTRWFRNLASGTFGMISLVIWLGVIFGGIFALWYFRQPLWDGIAGLLNSK
jgi:hypothetical protein